MPEDLTLKLSKEIRQKVHDGLFDTTIRATELCSDRNALMRELRAVANCEDDSAPQGPYPGASSLTDPLTQEVCRTVEAHCRQSLGEKVYLYQALRAEDMRAAQVKEQWINGRMLQDGFKAGYAQAVRNACETLGGVLCADWREEYRYETDVLYRDKENGELRDEEGRDPSREYTPEPVYHEAEAVRQGVDYRSPDPWDIYPWPVSVTAPDAADRIMEYWPLTRSDLLMRVTTEGFNEAAVAEAIRLGPTTVVDSDETANEMQGVAQGPDSELPYPCYRAIGRMPLLTDEHGRLDKSVPPEYLFRDCLWIYCPALRLVFKECLYWHAIRPYTIVKMFVRPNCFWGDSPASQARSLQDQASASMRQYIDGGDQLAAPQCMVEEDYANFLDGQLGIPGGVIGIPLGAHPEPWKLDPQGVMMSHETNSYVVARARQDFLADAQSSLLSGKSRKAAEVEQTARLILGKLGIISQNLEFALDDFEPRVEVQYLAHLDADEKLRRGGEDQDVTREALTKRFRIVSQVSREQMNQESRVRLDMELFEVLQKSQIFQRMVMQQDLTGEYRILSKIIADMGEDPEAYIGTEDTYDKMREAAQQAAQAQQGAPGQPGAVPGQPGQPAQPGGADPQAMQAQMIQQLMAARAGGQANG